MLDQESTISADVVKAKVVKPLEDHEFDTGANRGHNATNKEKAGLFISTYCVTVDV